MIKKLTLFFVMAMMIAALFACTPAIVQPAPVEVVKPSKTALLPTEKPAEATAVPTVILPEPTLVPTEVPPEPTLAPTEVPPEPTAVDLQPTEGSLPTDKTRVSERDGMEQVFVPAGDFLMGSTEDEIQALLKEQADIKRDRLEAQQPQHKIMLKAFWIDKFEVTNSQYALCVKDKACTAPTDESSYLRDTYYGDAEFDNYPVIYTTWKMAQSYCMWAGRRLPTEAEWEKAALGTDGNRKFPWGNEALDGTRANICDTNCTDEWKNNKVDDGYEDTSPVGAFPAGASPYGALDMAGNVYEWMADWYDVKYYATSPDADPQGPASGEYRSLRGGGCFSEVVFNTSAYRGKEKPDEPYDDIGFRCVSE